MHARSDPSLNTLVAFFDPPSEKKKDYLVQQDFRAQEEKKVMMPACLLALSALRGQRAAKGCIKGKSFLPLLIEAARQNQEFSSAE